MSRFGQCRKFSVLSVDRLKLRRWLMLFQALGSIRVTTGAAIFFAAASFGAFGATPASAFELCSDAFLTSVPTTESRTDRSKGARAARSMPTAPHVSAFRLIGERLRDISSGTDLGAALYKLATEPSQSAWLKSPIGTVQPHRSSEALRKGPLGPILRHLSEPMPVVYLVRNLSLPGRKTDKIVSVILRDPIDEGFRIATLLDSQMLARRDYPPKAQFLFGLDQTELAELRSAAALPTAELALRLVAFQQFELIKREQDSVQRQSSIDAWNAAAPTLVTDSRYKKLFERASDPDYLTRLAMDRLGAQSVPNSAIMNEHKLIGAIQLLIRERLAFISAQPGEQSLVPVNSIHPEAPPERTDWDLAPDQLYAALMIKGYFWDRKKLKWFSIAASRSRERGAE